MIERTGRRWGPPDFSERKHPMMTPRRRVGFVVAALALILTCAGASLSPSPALAQLSLFQREKYAAIVVDAQNGEVLYARRADDERYPASISKIMTLYLAFDALAHGRLSPGDQVTVSSHAANQAPSKLGLKPGESISVDLALRAIAVKSANDIAVAMAEKIGGSESRFAAMMTMKAHELGMRNSRFVNASGLPDNRQISTARDIALLSRAVMRDFPQYYSYFGIKSFEFRGREITNHNGLLRRMYGVDGLKTGFTNAAGFNLAASATRGGKRLIAVVLGGTSTAIRDENVEDLLNAGFEVMAKRAAGQTVSLASLMHEPEDLGGPIVRPPTEMGSAEQDGLKIVPASMLPVTIKPQPTRHTAAVARVERPYAHCQVVKLKGRGHKTRTVCSGGPDGLTAAGCRTVSHAFQTACLAQAKLAAAKSEGDDSEDAPKTVCHKKGHKRVCVAVKAPAKKAEAKKAEAKKADKETYAILVGAYRSQTQAKTDIHALGRKFSDVLSDDAFVEKAGKGRFHARYTGFTKAEAGAACRKLNAHGHRCSVTAG